MAAAERGHTSLITFYISRGFPLAGMDGAGYNALHIAAKNGHIEAVQYLVGIRADTMATVNTGATALSIAAESGHDAVATYLLSVDRCENMNIPEHPEYRRPGIKKNLTLGQ